MTGNGTQTHLQDGGAVSRRHCEAPARRRFIRLAGGGTLAAALPSSGALSGCQVFSGMPESALEPWQGPGNVEDVRLWSMSWAILAPNPHNRQPWLLTLVDNDSIVLSLDPERLLPDTDPLSRQILIGTGALLGLLEIAAAERGYRLETTLFPQGEFGESPDDRPVARIRFIADTAARTSDTAALFTQIPHRHTRRDAYVPSRAPSSAFLDKLNADVARIDAAGLRTGLVRRDRNAAMFDRIGEITASAWRTEVITPHTMLESMRLLRVGAREIERHRDGISLTEPLVVALNMLGMLDRSKAPAADSAMIKRLISDFDTALASTPAFYWLASRGNSRSDQLLCGRAYVRAQLLATADGLVMQPLSQALQEYEEVRSDYVAIHTLIGESLANGLGKEPTVQMLCRIGYPATGVDEVTPAPRRGVQAHLLSA